MAVEEKSIHIICTSHEAAPQRNSGFGLLTNYHTWQLPGNDRGVRYAGACLGENEGVDTLHNEHMHTPHQERNACLLRGITACDETAPRQNPENSKKTPNNAQAQQR